MTNMHQVLVGSCLFLCFGLLGGCNRDIDDPINNSTENRILYFYEPTITLSGGKSLLNTLAEREFISEQPDHAYDYTELYFINKPLELHDLKLMAISIDAFKENYVGCCAPELPETRYYFEEELEVAQKRLVHTQNIGDCEIYEPVSEVLFMKEQPQSIMMCK